MRLFVVVSLKFYKIIIVPLPLCFLSSFSISETHPSNTFFFFIISFSSFFFHQSPPLVEPNSADGKEGACEGGDAGQQRAAGVAGLGTDYRVHQPVQHVHLRQLLYLSFTQVMYVSQFFGEADESMNYAVIILDNFTRSRYIFFSLY